ncbi:hypothetical protein CYLTODRAFT_114827 [Cylindrobasidium torrendii FP15055 ss-10]|uniref:Uncharacterized protein n=1 Tax=Cylindrobasidium torrendii FP15055 ss-10 TaxID=1314674 RepID=A0A0D7B0P5_9AGAR|nr:hypothetical protein CYLTODRAFT_114827 [Cylindrobasidium torrendii FP15055 ss-10]
MPKLNLDHALHSDTPTRPGLVASAVPLVTPVHVAARPESPQPLAGPSAPAASKATVQDPDSQDTTSSGDLSRIERAPEQLQRMEEEESSRDLEEEVQQRLREKEAAEEARLLLEREEAEARKVRQDALEAAERMEKARERRFFELEEQEQIELERIAERQRERRNRETMAAASKLRDLQLIRRNGDENMDVDSIPPVAGPSVPPLFTSTVDVAGAAAHFSATLSVVEPTTRAGSDSSSTLPVISSSLVTTEEALPNDIEQLKALVRTLKAAPRSHDSEAIAGPSEEDINALKVANASLLQNKMALTEEREFFRGHYEAQSALANDLIKEKRAWEAERTRLQSEVQIARGQAKDGVALVRATLEGRIEWLEADAAQWRDQVHFMRELELRTNGPGVRADELRRRAAEYPNMEVELQRVKTQLVEERAKSKERDKDVQRALAEREVLRQELDQEREVKEQKVRENEKILLALESARRAYEQNRINAGPGSQQASDVQMASQPSSAGIANAAVNALAGGTSSAGLDGSQGAYFCEMDDVGFSTMDVSRVF